MHTHVYDIFIDKLGDILLACLHSDIFGLHALVSQVYHILGIEKGLAHFLLRTHCPIHISAWTVFGNLVAERTLHGEPRRIH